MNRFLGTLQHFLRVSSLKLSLLFFLVLSSYNMIFTLSFQEGTFFHMLIGLVSLPFFPILFVIYEIVKLLPCDTFEVLGVCATAASTTRFIIILFLSYLGACFIALLWEKWKALQPDKTKVLQGPEDQSHARSVFIVQILLMYVAAALFISVVYTLEQLL
ncbi:hypothetical protein HYW21_04485 [Candidatus Woesearchaeota archaeon]|nr:hypothetical protein [Candidatus Woesearchaeota archaeon]